MPDKKMLDKALYIIGDEDAVSGFKAIGFETIFVKDINECRKVIGDILKKDSAICLLQDDFYKAQEETASLCKDKPLTVFIPFSKEGRVGLLGDIVKGIRLRATGAF